LRLDYFLLQLPHHGTRLVGRCVGCAAPVLKAHAGGAFICKRCEPQHCGWCGYSMLAHRLNGEFDTRRIVGSNPAAFQLPPGQCPTFNQAVCADCFQQFRPRDRVIITCCGVIHSDDCCDGLDVADVEAPYLREDSAIMPKLLQIEQNCDDGHDMLLAAINELPRPWWADTITRTP
jgi:hypothetical protein